jgi:hypothetical protein
VIATEPTALAQVVDRAIRDGMGHVLAIDDPIAQLESMAALLEEWRDGEETLLEARRRMVQGFEAHLSYRLMADALGCSKANIHQILHPQAKAG